MKHLAEACAGDLDHQRGRAWPALIRQRPLGMAERGAAPHAEPAVEPRLARQPLQRRVAARVVRNFDDFPEELVRLRLPRARISQEGPRLIRQFFPFSLFPAAVWSAEPAECWQRYLARLSLFPASF